LFEFVSFTDAFTSQYVVKPVKETCKTVHSIAKETCQQVTRFDEFYKTACFWGVNETSKDGHVYDLGLCKFVEYFHVFPTSYLRHRKGPAMPERDLKNMYGRKLIGDTFFQLELENECGPSSGYPKRYILSNL